VREGDGEREGEAVELRDALGVKDASGERVEKEEAEEVPESAGEAVPEFETLMLRVALGQALAVALTLEEPVGVMSPLELVVLSGLELALAE